MVFLYNFILYQNPDICILLSFRCSQMAHYGPYFIKIFQGPHLLAPASSSAPEPRWGLRPQSPDPCSSLLGGTSCHLTHSHCINLAQHFLWLARFFTFCIYALNNPFYGYIFMAFEYITVLKECRHTKFVWRYYYLHNDK